LATISAELNFIPYVNKYIIEASVIVTAVMIGGIQYYLDGTESAISTLTVFLAAGSRIAPALLRIQQGTISIKNGLGVADPFFQLLDILETKKEDSLQKAKPSDSQAAFVPSVKLFGVSFIYPGAKNRALSDIHLTIKPGESCAIAGPSGAGKSTLADVILGIIEPAEGIIEISESEPLNVFSKWAGQVSYVPQDITLIKGTIRENVSLGYPEDSDTVNKVLSALDTAQLLGFISTLPDGIDTQIGEKGAKLSGGQRQRIGLARALFTKPKLLVLDEATSALDFETEAAITQAIGELKGQTTIVVIAHRLDTIRKLDQVVYLRDGKIFCKGTYEEVSKLVPELRD
jgi:ABC-type multidrug transport system fused ATPase/permease subunit